MEEAAKRTIKPGTGGLDPAANYTLSSIEGKTLPGEPQTASGAWWMNHGLEMDMGFRGDFQVVAFRLDRQ
jgi:alpha-galactosidase